MYHKSGRPLLLRGKLPMVMLFSLTFHVSFSKVPFQTSNQVSGGVTSALDGLPIPGVVVLAKEHLKA